MTKNDKRKELIILYGRLIEFYKLKFKTFTTEYDTELEIIEKKINDLIADIKTEPHQAFFEGIKTI